MLEEIIHQLYSNERRTVFLFMKPIIIRNKIIPGIEEVNGKIMILVFLSSSSIVSIILFSLI